MHLGISLMYSLMALESLVDRYVQRKHPTPGSVTLLNMTISSGYISYTGDATFKKYFGHSDNWGEVIV